MSKVSHGEPLKAVYLFMGDATLLVNRAAKQVEAAGLARCGLPAFNHSTSRCSDTNAAAALTTARTVPMMADLRVVVLRDLEQGDATLLEAVLEYIKDPSPSTVFIATGGKFPRTAKGGTNWQTRLQNAAKKSGVLQKFALKDVSPAAFVRDHARSLGKGLARGVPQLLVEIVGADLGRLASELDKVALYVDERSEITCADVTEVCSMVAEAVVWDLTTGLASGNSNLALGALYRLLEEDPTPHRPMGLIAWQLRQVLQIAERVRAGASPREIRSSVRMNPRSLDTILRAVGPDFPGSEQIMERLAIANRLMNSHPAGGRRILETLVVDLCSLVPTRTA